MSSRNTSTELQRSILSLYRCSGHSLSCQAPQSQPGAESMARPPRWSGQLQRALCQRGMRRGTRAGATPSTSCIWATSKTTFPIPKRISCATDKPPFSHGLHVWKSMLYCAIQTDFKAKKSKSNSLLQFDIKALVIKHVTIPLVF